ncbi:alpha/beta fold hydrolase [Phenylobacterium kunshanense]|uniref:Alpha/beta hydrolase n=1 Tax=Phenylobacterium kunshanense TaxID=1445034 RepID=A0A328BG80_9CAUL|nr:alpha/beta hydrolase [Phenylobacterium kunshanense]RAK65581.1 alpha/beta hydrolase [Phenylobacterium kunshanense]
MLRAALAAATLLLAAAPAADAAPRDRTATNGDVNIHYAVEGEGPLVVLIHGFPDYWGTWTPLMAELNKAGYRTAALDLRGYNLSDKPMGVEAYAMPNLVGDVAAVIAAEGRKDAIVIGHDWGAAIAWRVAFQRPELVRRLVIMSVPHPAGMGRELATNKAQQEGSNYARVFQQEGSEKALNAEALAAWVKDPAKRAAQVEALKRSDFAAMMNYYRANYPRAGGAPPADPQPPVASMRVKVPTLVIHGMKDTALNAAGHSGTWDFIDADTTIVMAPAAGHFVQHDAEALVNRTVRDWLDARR